EVRKLYAVSGQHDCIAIVVTDTVGEMDRLLDLMGSLDGIDRTVSSIVLSTRIDR
ncbi:MAG: Lrp/AsnC ligand binding domain-containing protein, partial [Gammaproteobacteria bacterium]|nr:Lrp/AsnC ligand binding domain-containing protein [Gammaproteobacteria bacterium]